MVHSINDRASVACLQEQRTGLNYSEGSRSSFHLKSLFLIASHFAIFFFSIFFFFHIFTFRW